MKKVNTSIIFLLVALIVPLYAGDAPLDVSTTIDFRATTTWGYNVDTGTTGFETALNWFELRFTPTGYKTQKSKPGGIDESYSFFSITGLDLTIIATPDGYDSNGTDNEENIYLNWINFVNMTAKLVTPWVWFGIIYQGSEDFKEWHYHRFVADQAMIGSRTCYRALQGGAMGSYDDLTDASWRERHRDLFQAAYETAGHLLIGYDQDIFSLVGKIGSRYDWTHEPSGGEELAQEYAFGLDATIRPIEGLIIGVDAYGTTYVDSTGDPMFSAKVTYDIPLYRGMYIQPFICCDTQVTIHGPNMEIAGGFNIPWEGGGYKEDPIYILENGSPNADRSTSRFTKQTTFGGLTLGASCFIPGGIDPDAETPEFTDPGAPVTTEPIVMIDMSIFEARGDEGFVDNLGLVLSMQLYDIMETTFNTREFGIAAYVDYELFGDIFLPILAFQYQNYNYDPLEPITTENTPDNMNLSIGLHYIQIPYTTIGIEYDTGNLLAEDQEISEEPEWGSFYVFLSILY